MIGRPRRERREAHAEGDPSSLPAPPRWSQPIPEPDIPAGWRTGPPDFVGVGAQRAGTSWWYRFAIDSHPRVARVEDQRKELHFFDRFWRDPVPEDLAERYARLFPRPEGAVTGEWTPRYMHDPWALTLLRNAAPQARILVLLRDPVDRYLSGLTRDLRIARRDGRHLAMAYVNDQIARSAYGEQLRQLFELFDRERVLVLQYERCSAEPGAEMERTCRFLGLEPTDEPPAELTQRRRPPREKPELSAEVRAALVERLAPDVARTAKLCPDLDLRLWPDFAGSASR